jgi:conjugal transfer pilus assembly protein TraF
MDKSSRFATVSERVVQGDPLLDQMPRRPTAPYGRDLEDRHASEAADALLGRLAQTAALWCFYRSDCPYCDAQAPLLEALAARYGFTVLAVSLDGTGLPDGRFPDYRVDSGQAQVLGVLSTPALFLARPDEGDVAPIAQGLLSLSQLRERIVLAAVQAGWITEAEAQHAKATVTRTHLAPAALAVLPEDPASLLESLRRLALQDPSTEAPQ